MKIPIFPSKFHEKILREAKKRNWDLNFYRNAKNEPITNLFKSIIKQICKQENIQLSNDFLSKILNTVRKHYSDEGILSAGLYPAEAFFLRSKYSISENLGDLNSCFMQNNCNEGNALWLINEDKYFDRVKFVVFHYQNNNNKTGIGRCWVFRVSRNAIFATNFYSKGFEIKDESFKFLIVRILRKLFGLSENVKFTTKQNIPLLIYLNNNGIIIYESTIYQDSNEVIEELKNLTSKCLWCNTEINLSNLRKYEAKVYYAPLKRKVKGLIVCKNCVEVIKNFVECFDCQKIIPYSDAIYIGNGDYLCRNCYRHNWTICPNCESVRHREYMIYVRYRRLCRICMQELGAVCNNCGEYFYFDSIKKYKVVKNRSINTIYLCDDCVENLQSYCCVKCQSSVKYLKTDYYHDADLRRIVRLDLCPDCYKEKLDEIFEFVFKNEQQPSLLRLQDT